MNMRLDKNSNIQRATNTLSYFLNLIQSKNTFLYAFLVSLPSYRENLLQETNFIMRIISTPT